MTGMIRNLLFLPAYLVLTCACYSAPRLAPTLNTDLSGTNSVVYCPTLQIAWEGLERVVGGPIEMQKQAPLVTELNHGNCPTGVVPEVAHVAMAGFADQGIAAKLEGALRQKFGTAAPKLPPILSDTRTAIVTYCYLSRKLPFPVKFARSKNVPLEFRSLTSTQAVEFFGAPQRNADDFASQVDILHYASDDDFVIRLNSSVKDEFILMAKIPQPNTLSAAVETAGKHLQDERKGFTELNENGTKQFFINTLSQGDLLAIPIVNLAVSNTFPDLCGRLFKNAGFEQVWLQEVYQDVDFKMDEAGATVHSTAYAAAFGGGSSKPRRFVFDKPFLLTLWKDKAPQPYLAIWVASWDVLVPFRKQTKTGTTP